MKLGAIFESIFLSLKKTEEQTSTADESDLTDMTNFS